MRSLFEIFLYIYFVSLLINQQVVENLEKKVLKQLNAVSGGVFVCLFVFLIFDVLTL